MTETTKTVENYLHEFCEQYPHNKRKYIRLAQIFVRDSDVAEDIVNDSFISLWENRNHITEPQTLDSYFNSIIRNNCKNWIRNKQTQLKIQQGLYATGYRLLQYDLCSLDELNTNSISTKEIQNILKTQLQKMPKQTRSVFIESRFNDMTYDNIAQKYGISVRMVTREIQSALSILRVSLKDYLPIIAMYFAFLLA